MLRIILIIVIILIFSTICVDIIKVKNKKVEKFDKKNKEKVFVKNPKTNEQQLNPIIIQKIMNDDYYVSGISNANNVGIRARTYDHFKPDRLDMKNVKNDINN